MRLVSAAEPSPAHGPSRAGKPIRRTLVWLLACGLTAGAFATSPASARPETTAAGRDGPVTTVTLVTGDQVRLIRRAKGYSAVGIAAPERTGVVFGVRQQGDSVWVIPSDAVALVASGRLDERLFEVSALAENGYGDDARPGIPLIVQHSKGKPVRRLTTGAVTGRELTSISSTVVEQDKRTATKFWKWLTGHTKTVPGQRARLGGAYAAQVQHLWLDGPTAATLDRSVPQIGAPAAWKKGYTGKGVKVAVLDSGIDTTHPDLEGAVVASANFSHSPGTSDRYGHGTHVASTIAGDGAASDGKYKGVAPDAVLLNGKCSMTMVETSSPAPSPGWNGQSHSRPGSSASP
ncbi:S8/S53 family peptidase [Flindersiella endophytica]